MRKFIYKLNIMQQLLLYFSIVIFVAIALVTWLIYYQAENEMKDQAKKHLEYIVENTSYQTDRYIRDLELATLPLLTDVNIKYFLDLHTNQSLASYNLYTEIKKKMSHLSIQHPDINLIYLIGENGRYVLSEDRIFEGSESIPSKSVYDRLLETTSESGSISILMSPGLHNHQHVVTIKRRVRGLTSFIPKGILGLEINASSLDKLWNIAQLPNGTTFGIVDSNGSIVYSLDESWLGKPLPENIWDKFRGHKKGTFTTEWEKEETIFYYTHSTETDWTLVAMTPEKIVLEPVSGMKRNAIFAATVALLFALIISIFFTRSIVIPLRRVQTGMKKMEQGEWERIKALHGEDEISSVVKSYNKMVERVSNLIEDLYKSQLKNKTVQIEKQRIELQALQSQINPHFLHNTLETMNAYAILNEADEISEMTEALSQMFRYSVRNFEVVTLEDELKHIRNFLIVQEHRFQRKIDVVFDISHDLYKEDVVKLSLQPLVENAIHHGLRKKRYEGKIIINAELGELQLIVKVIDDGSGISVERLAEINANLSSSSEESTDLKMGIGVSNVHRRIQLIFGKQYGLRVHSEEGNGTTVEMNLPRNVLIEKIS
ncbi:histidine kinase [Anaerobacillus sp. CMMVII]|uniref:cache domain-containing sensor histidine kinase n=1 Tax=Anaerobacillus sp. CMMVII TaxID=2755588 RepID=UPI0021B7CAD8|nr:histidine kinase [Anaerobacillus sp. CMMVII]MCT8139254.1 histidine kinase [Anaerobacillus sp. CMMVII]